MEIEKYKPRANTKHVLDVFKSRPDIFPENEVRELIEELRTESVDTHLKIVAIDREIVVGYAAVKFSEVEKVWYLHWLAVSKKFQRQGVGSKLINYVFDWLKEKNVKNIFVETCGCTGECPARNFYIKNGFKQIKIEKDGYNPGHDRITFEKKL